MSFEANGNWECEHMRFTPASGWTCWECEAKTLRSRVAALESALASTYHAAKRAFVNPVQVDGHYVCEVPPGASTRIKGAMRDIISDALGTTEWQVPGWSPANSGNSSSQTKEPK